MEQSSFNAQSEGSEVSANVVDNAVGVPSRNWYIGIVRRNTERAISERLSSVGIESYVATQKEKKRWRNGRNVVIDRVVISSIVFVKATEEERKQTMYDGLISRYMTNPSSSLNAFGRHSLAIVNENELERLRFMLYNADNPVDFITQPLRKGEKVRVVRGALQGFEGNVVEQNDTTYVYITLELLGCAMTRVPLEDIERTE